MQVGFATNHGGYILKEPLLKVLRDSGHEIVDFGAFSLNPSDDYPDFVIPLAKAVALGKVDRGRHARTGGDYQCESRLPDLSRDLWQ